MPEISLLLPLCKELEISVNELLTGVKCLRDIGSGRLDSTHNLDDNLNLRVFQNLLPAVCKETAVHPLSLSVSFPPQEKELRTISAQPHLLHYYHSKEFSFSTHPSAAKSVSLSDAFLPGTYLSTLSHSEDMDPFSCRSEFSHSLMLPSALHNK